MAFIGRGHGRDRAQVASITRRLNPHIRAGIFRHLCVVAEETGVDVDVDAHADTVSASGAAAQVRAWIDAAERLGALHRRRNQEPEH